MPNMAGKVTNSRAATFAILIACSIKPFSASVCCVYHDNGQYLHQGYCFDSTEGVYEETDPVEHTIATCNSLNPGLNGGIAILSQNSRCSHDITDDGIPSYVCKRLADVFRPVA